MNEILTLSKLAGVSNVVSSSLSNDALENKQHKVMHMYIPVSTITLVVSLCTAL